MNTYQSNIETLTKEAENLSARDKKMSITRLIVALASATLFYQYYSSDQPVLLICGLLSTAVFLLLVRKHRVIRWKRRMADEKVAINQDEISYLEKGELVYEDGAELSQHDHPYSYDLDFFGNHSLFQSLNRTATLRGKQILAKSLLSILPKQEIEATQEAVKELTPLLDWRHEIYALGRLEESSQEGYDQLMEWSQKPGSKSSLTIRILTFVLPILVLTMMFGYFVLDYSLAGNITGMFMLLNLVILGLHYKELRYELLTSTETEKVLKQYALLLKSIEDQAFQSRKLKGLQATLKQEQENASKAIQQLSALFERLEHLTNIFAGPILNGILLYHVHILRGIKNWRQNHARHVKQWLDVIGEMEKLNSLANFHYNNPSFTYPNINTEKRIEFEDLGHPLIPGEKTVTNSISFKDHNFFILTGSNMSGKSTFLRTVGVNMVLAGIGAPVFSKRATVHPLPVLVSMRLSDSLNDSESYFYAEVKRLKYIMDRLEQEPCFVLLDEILRGTNSDDKRNGTIEVIRKMAKKEVFGGIATHDLEVCNVANEFSDSLINKRFEVEIVNDELVFDYKLRDGICQNKSASFIMKKMEVI
ncbi:MAG: DNA mismatch repair protein [Ekhidna sp.]|nr:DNA mismatch repair protein [Ekhidna sp.]